jgi:DNA ligase D-like protein (predicted 3'-phosphoesterase)
MDGDPRFVVQQHDARRLHYDFRVEADGVLISWAVPKGPSYDPRVKRLAIHVGDHDLEHRHFEGVIPDARYGSGAVIIWDEGTYRNLTARSGSPVAVTDAVRAGHLSVWLEGEKLQGGWSLTRTGWRGGGSSDRLGDGGVVRNEAWILVKRVDDHAEAGLDITTAAPESVRTGRRLADLSR